MQNQDKDTQETATAPQIIEIPQEHTEELALQTDAETLNTLEPAAGQTPSQTQDTTPRSADFQTQISELAQTISLDSAGALEETELEYTLNTASLRAINTRTPIGETTAPNVPQTVLRERPPAEEPVQRETTIKLSNQTTNQNTINNADNYEITAQTNKNVKLYGDDMNIETVADNARVDYKFKSDETFRANLKSGWNSVKNISVKSNELDTVTLKNFVHADVTLYGGDNSKVKIINAKRGNIETEDGNDVIIIKALTNGAGWSNTFDIGTGAGNDIIRAKGDDGHTIFDINAGSQNDIVRIRGDYDHAEINLGSGNDRVHGGNGSDIILGGEGNDKLFGGNDIDIALFMGSIDEYTITKRGGKYLIEDSIDGRDGTDTLKSIEGLIFGLEDLITSTPNAQTASQNSDILDLSQLLDNNDPLQTAIDNFVHQADQGQATSASIQNDVPSLAIFTPQDAILETQTIIL